MSVQVVITFKKQFELNLNNFEAHLITNIRHTNIRILFNILFLEDCVNICVLEEE